MLSTYMLPLAVVGFALMIAFWRIERRQRKSTLVDLEQARAMQKQLERERDTASHELFRRFLEEGKLNHERADLKRNSRSTKNTQL